MARTQNAPPTTADQPEPAGIGACIRAARRARGWTQSDLAISVGVSRSAVAQWETDRTGQLRAHLGRIARSLGVCPDVLLGGTNAVPRADERALLNLYRDCTDKDRQVLLRTARRLARQASLQKQAAPETDPGAALHQR